MSSSDLERKKKLEKLKRSTNNKLVNRAADILSRDISESITDDMRDDWRYCEVPRRRKEIKGNESIEK